MFTDIKHAKIKSLSINDTILTTSRITIIILKIELDLTDLESGIIVENITFFCPNNNGVSGFTETLDFNDFLDCICSVVTPDKFVLPD